jgi:cation:H+ antiporter
MPIVLKVFAGVAAIILGSFSYNVTMTLGLAAFIKPISVLSAETLDVPALIMLGALLLLLLSTIWRKIGKPTAFLLSGGYLAYILFIIFML